MLVTGGAGFIGSHIADSLLSAGYSIVCVDDLSAGSLENVNKKAIFRKASILSNDFEKIFSEFSFDAVVHHAAQIDVRKSLENPKSDIDTNLLGTLAVLENAKKHGTKKVIFASTAAVYGDESRLPIKEDASHLPISTYGVSKLAAELLINAYFRQGISSVSLRYSNVYGPRQGNIGEGGVVSIFVKSLMRGKHPIIFGDGMQTRDFIYVKDIADANVLALKFLDSRQVCEVANISSMTQTSVLELLKLISGLMKTDVNPKFVTERQGEIKHSCLDNSKAKAMLGWMPKTDLKNGIEETIRYFNRL